LRPTAFQGGKRGERGSPTVQAVLGVRPCGLDENPSLRHRYRPEFGLPEIGAPVALRAQGADMAGGSGLVVTLNERDILFVLNFGPVESFHERAQKIAV
jgi:hypothetical protein